MAVLPENFVLLQVVPALDAGGVERTTLDISRAVVEAGGRSLVASEGGRLEAELTAHGGELVKLPIASKSPFTALFNAADLRRIIDADQVSLVHVRSRAPAFAAGMAARATGTPLISTYHGVYNAKGPLKRWYNGVMVRTDHVIANSAYTRHHVLETYGVPEDHVTAIPRGTDPAVFDPKAVSAERLAAARTFCAVAPNETRTVFLLAGRLTRWKGQLLAVEAARRLKASGRDDFLLVIVGDDQGRVAYRAEIEAAIVAGDLSENVCLAGHMIDMPAAFLACDVALVPSLEPEAFGRTAVEPQLMGRPVIVAAHGAPVDTVIDDETGWHVRPNDPDDLARRMKQAMDAGPKARAAMGTVARARAKTLYSVKAMVDATFAVYRRVLGEAH